MTQATRRTKIIQWIETRRHQLRESPWARFIPVHFLNHYVIPLISPGGKKAYDSRSYWDRWYAQAREFSDGITVDDQYNPLFVRYHYNSTENSLIRYFARQPLAQPTVLDIGSGAGHWISFYREVFHAEHVTGVDTSASCISALRDKFLDVPNIKIEECDISAPNVTFEKSFDIINAIGVMFHIVEDDAWERALRTLAAALKPNGVIAIGGHFGWITQNVQFFGPQENPHAFVYKRVRSLRSWRNMAAKCGLIVVGLERTTSSRGIRTPQNNILFLKHRQ